MSSLVKVSEAASLGLHAMAFLAGSAAPVSTHTVAKALKVSGAHLSKVFQRLTRAGLVRSARGPHGGFVLARPASSTSLLAVYEAIEGRLTITHCLFAKPVCHGECILGDLLTTVNELARRRLADTKLSQLTHLFGARS